MFVAMDIQACDQRTLIPCGQTHVKVSRALCYLLITCKELKLSLHRWETNRTNLILHHKEFEQPSSNLEHKREEIPSI